MAIDPATLREEALRLPTEARVDTWNAEIAERLRAVDAGEIKPVPWNEARRRIARED
jgi:hypothetical protein